MKFSIIFICVIHWTLCSPINIQKNTVDVCPNIINRSEWKARNVTGHQLLPISPVPYVVIHHGGILQYCYDQKECSRIVRSYQDLHIDTNRWLDIGYNFVIGEDSNIYEGRGWDYVGAHAPGYNTQSIGVSIIGDFSHFLPNRGALEALHNLIECGVSLGKISTNYSIIGHRQGRNTVCPGEEFFNYVMTMPRWTSTPVPVYSNKSQKSNKIVVNLKNPSNHKLVTIIK
ncbi:peptidoglycan-recognition protein SC2-like [Chelonus insularis]|uniref:peptidoglycan-recognition protein SC2-like n=1 Tax=Chelonus insularis TaxID=460826 RepID=UPI00158F4EC1|nr:peptidoglycan-recognition protein SC2-like [Chelonus insularis]